MHAIESQNKEMLSVAKHLVRLQKKKQVNVQIWQKTQVLLRDAACEKQDKDAASITGLIIYESAANEYLTESTPSNLFDISKKETMFGWSPADSRSALIFPEVL